MPAPIPLRSDLHVRTGCVALSLLFLLIYVEWGSRGEFIFQMALPVFRHAGQETLTHPLVIGPAIAIALLLTGAIVPRLPRWLLVASTLPPAILAVIVLTGGIGSRSAPMVLSVIPFFIAWLLLCRHLLRKRS